VSDDNALDDEFARMAGGRKLGQELRRNLEKLRDGGAGPDLAEMARDVLAGRISVRDVSRSTAYAGPLSDAMDRYRDALDGMSDEERQRLVAEAEERFRDDEDPR
jgi:hypothetical protein